jgi:GNAT superfamily N-acetyltransferase
MKISIKRPDIKEKQHIYSLFDTTIRHTFKGEGIEEGFELIGELIDDQKALIDSDFETDGRDVFFLVAECGGEIAGTICHRPCSDIIIDCVGKQAKGRQEIGSVYILPRFQRKGISKLLLNAMYITLISRGIGEFYLDTGYTQAKEVWRKALGEPSLIMKDYWGEGISHHIWHKKLNEITIGFSI